MKNRSNFTLWVDASALHNGDGTQAMPFRSLEAAQIALRTRKAEGLPEGGVTMMLRPGSYRLKKGLVFTGADSGTEAAPIHWCAEQPGSAVLTGALQLSRKDFEPLSAAEKARIVDASAAEKLIKIDLRQRGLTLADWGKLSQFGYVHKDIDEPNEAELFCNGQRMILSRYPNAETLRTVSVPDNGDCKESCTDMRFMHIGVKLHHPEYDQLANPRGGTFEADRETAQRLGRWDPNQEIWAHGCFKFGWAEANTPVSHIDPEQGHVTLRSSMTFGLSIGAPYHFYNVFEELDAPGEYYIDRDKGILYCYPPTEDEDAVFELSTISTPVITFDGASHISLEGLVLSGSRSHGIAGGTHHRSSNGIYVSGGGNHHLTVKNCEICSVRGGGIDLAGQDITIADCHIHDTGALGICVAGGDAKTLTSSNNRILNNHIHHFGRVERLYQPGLRLWGVGCLAAHNEICYAPHCAVIYADQMQILENNNIHHVCLDTDDAGAIYAGRSFIMFGCEIRGNHIHQIGNLDRGVISGIHGIYLDDAVSGQTVCGNVIEDIGGGHGIFSTGRNNRIQDNVLINVRGRSAIRAEARLSNSERDPHHHFGDLAGDRWGMYRVLRESPRHTPAWKAAFPALTEILIPFPEEYDPDNPLHAPNAADCVITGNRVYETLSPERTDEELLVIEEAVARLSRVEDNLIERVMPDVSSLTAFVGRTTGA